MEQKQFRKETKPVNLPGVISPPMVEKSGKKLWVFTIFTTLIVGCIVFCAVLFFTLLAGSTLVAAYTYAWPAFTFVWGGMWSKGIHLFSVWAALFLTSVVLCAALVCRRALEEAEKRTTARAKTILKLADSFTAYAAGAVIVIGVLYMFGVNTTAVLASAGIVSIAVGMGAKDMAADILAGLFIAFEDSIHMGDVVMVGEWKGRVTNMGIRTIEITDDSGNVKILSNSRVNDVVNMSWRGS